MSSMRTRYSLSEFVHSTQLTNLRDRLFNPASLIQAGKTPFKIISNDVQKDGLVKLRHYPALEGYPTIHRVPLVQIGRNTDHPEIQVVNIDGWIAGKQLAELLLAQGHRTFGYMKGPDTASHHLMRMEGYEAALEQADCRLDTLLVAGQYLRTRGYAAMSDYLDATSAGERVDALFCENDILAIGALQALRERDLTMGIVGFDNIDEAAAPEWQLTTYDQRRERLVEEALNRLIDAAEGPTATWRTGEPIVRQSHRRQG